MTDMPEAAANTISLFTVAYSFNGATVTVKSLLKLRIHVAL